MCWQELNQGEARWLCAPGRFGKRVSGNNGERDNAVYTKLGLKNETREKVYAGNIRRFLGV